LKTVSVNAVPVARKATKETTMTLTLFIFIVCFLVVVCIGFDILIIVRGKSNFLRERVRQYLVAIFLSACSVGAIWKLSENELLFGLQAFFSIGFILSGSVSLMEAFEAERLWRNRKERQAAKRQ